jgi:large subunit ribosomal protein L24e
VIQERRSQRPEAREAARKAAIAKAKESKRVQAAAKKDVAKGQAPKSIVGKMQARGAPKKVMATSR